MYTLQVLSNDNLAFGRQVQVGTATAHRKQRLSLSFGGINEYQTEAEEQNTRYIRNQNVYCGTWGMAKKPFFENIFINLKKQVHFYNVIMI